MGIQLEHISYKYRSRGEEDSTYALSDVSLQIERGEYVAIVGCTGSGKSTLLQHMNGLLKPETGSYICDEEDVYGKGYSMKKLRRKVALCFQYPEYQLFEETILKDICYGPKNMGLPQEECLRKAREAMEMVGLPKELEDKSPFALSGGQKRRVAIAGILAMEPEYLILDEPVAGLDETGKKQLFQLLKDLNQNKKITIILVSHDMDDVISNADRVIVMKDGKIVIDGPVRQVFAHKDLIEAAGLELPIVIDFYHKLMERWKIDYEAEDQPINVSELAGIIAKRCKDKKQKMEASTCSEK